MDPAPAPAPAASADMLKKIAALMILAEISWTNGPDKRQYVLDELKKQLSAEDYAAVEPLALISIEVMVLLSRANIDLSKINPTAACKGCCAVS